MHIKYKLLVQFPEYSDEVISLTYHYLTGKKDKTWYLNLASLFTAVNEFKVCKELHDENISKIHIAVHLKANDWLKKNLKNYYSKFDENWSKKNSEHYYNEIDQKDKNGFTPLGYAIHYGNIEQVEILLPYSNILEIGSLKDFITDLINSDTDPEKIIDSITDFFNTKREIAKLIYEHVTRIKHNHLPPEIMANIVDKMLDSADADNVNSEGDQNPYEKYANAVQNLLASSNYRIEKSESNKTNLVNTLIDEDLIVDRVYLHMKKSDPNITKLHVAIYLKNMLWIKKNIDNIDNISFSDLLTADSTNKSPILMTIDSDNVKLFALLLSHFFFNQVLNLDEELRTQYNYTFFLVAARCNAYKIVEFLINQKLITNIDFQNENGDTALIMVARNLRDSQGADYQPKRIIKLLRQHGANPAIKNKQGECAASLAQYYYPEELSIETNTACQNSAIIDKMFRYLGLKKT